MAQPASSHLPAGGSPSLRRTVSARSSSSSSALPEASGLPALGWIASAAGLERTHPWRAIHENAPLMNWW